MVLHKSKQACSKKLYDSTTYPIPHAQLIPQVTSQNHLKDELNQEKAHDTYITMKLGQIALQSQKADKTIHLRKRYQEFLLVCFVEAEVRQHS